MKGPAGPLGARAVATITGGSVEGQRVSGKVLPSVSDGWIQRSDGVMVLDVRALFQTGDGALIYMTYEGRLHAAPEIAARLFNPETQESVHPADYYFRTHPVFETGDERYAWLNKIIAIGVGQLRPLLRSLSMGFCSKWRDQSRVACQAMCSAMKVEMK
ncbi:MAG: DUF3237 domain-containing protein [Pseudomonadota bacterium]